MKILWREIPINKFVGLKSKMYSILSEDDKESNTEKEVNTATEFSEFRDTLFNKKITRHKMKRIQSKKHKLRTYEINERSLSCFDDKRFFQMMEFIRLLILKKTQIDTNDRNSKRFSQ